MLFSLIFQVSDAGSERFFSTAAVKGTDRFYVVFEGSLCLIAVMDCFNSFKCGSVQNMIIYCPSTVI